MVTKWVTNKKTVMYLKWTKILGKTILLIHKNITPFHAVSQNDPIAFKSCIDIISCTTYLAIDINVHTLSNVGILLTFTHLMIF